MLYVLLVTVLTQNLKMFGVRIKITKVQIKIP